MGKFEQLFKKIDARLTERRFQLDQLEAVAPSESCATLHAAVNRELVDLQIRLRTDYTLITYPQKPLGQFFFWKVAIKAFFYRWKLKLSKLTQPR